MAEEITQRRAGFVRRILRAGMRASSHLYPKTPTVRQTRIDGMPLLVWANEYIGRRILMTGAFEAEDLGRLGQFVNRDDLCIDVGANIGLYSLYLARLVGPKGRVLAFEPVIRNALLTELSCQLNGFDQVTMFRQPLSSRSGLVLEEIAPEGDSAYSFFREREGRIDDPFTSITLDEAVEGAAAGAPVAFMKIDVEGGEFNVLLGGERLFGSDHRPRVVMMELVAEYLARFGHDVATVCEWMVDRGYRLHAIRDGRLSPIEAQAVDAENIFFLAT